MGLLVHSPKPLQAETTPAALEPWETAADDFFVRSHHGTPTSPDAGWVIVVDGLVKKPLRLTLPELKRKFKPMSFHAVLECSGNGRALQLPHASGVQWLEGAVGNAEWSGVALAEVLKAAGVKAEARFVRLEGADAPAFAGVPAFVRSVALAKALAPDTLLATAMNREPLPRLHGGPVRLVLPQWYGENWTKWVAHITLTASEDEGFFMKKAYRIPKEPVKPGEPWDSATGRPIEQLLVQTLINSPAADTEVKVGRVDVRGKAFSGAGAIVKVELSGDDGASWTVATLAKPHRDGGWQEFDGELQLTKPGPAVIVARATDAAGAVQPLEHTWNPGGYVRNAADRAFVRVAAAEPALDAREILADKCYRCHAPELVQEQRLSAGAWGKTLAKMEGFGVALSETEKSSLIEYLSQTPADAPLRQLSEVAGGNAEASARRAAQPATSRAAGARHFAEVCAPCHGAKAEGNVGPRLTGRLPAPDDFRAVVQFGQRSMPAFGALFKAAEIDAIYAFLQASKRP